MLNIQNEGSGVGNLLFRAGDYNEFTFEFKKKEGETLTDYVFAGAVEILLYKEGATTSYKTFSPGSNGVTLVTNKLTWGFAFGMEVNKETYVIREKIGGNKPDTIWKGQLLPQFDLKEYNVSTDPAIIIEKKAVTFQIQITKSGGGSGAGSPDTGAQIVSKLAALSGADRLSYSSLKDTPDLSTKLDKAVVTESRSGSFEISAADWGKVLKHTGTGTITKNANFTAGMSLSIIKQDGGVLTLGFTTEAYGTNAGTKLDSINPGITLIQNASTVTRIGELTV